MLQRDLRDVDRETSQKALAVQRDIIRQSSRGGLSSRATLPKPVASARSRAMMRSLRDTSEEIRRSQAESYGALKRTQRIIANYDDTKRYLALREVENARQGRKYREAMRVQERQLQATAKHVTQVRGERGEPLPGRDRSRELRTRYGSKRGSTARTSGFPRVVDALDGVAQGDLNSRLARKNRHMFESAAAGGRPDS